MSSQPGRGPVTSASAPPEPWPGSMVRVLACGQTADAAPAAPLCPAAQPAKPARVLVVDDDPVNLMLISARLKARGLVTLLAADGAEAVALACELRFDLVLMDLQMPILDGLGATLAIRRFERAMALPAVAVIAYSSALHPAGVLATCGIDGSLRKPPDDLELDACLLQWCAAHNEAPPDAWRCP